MHLLVNHSKDVVQNRLVSELYKEEFFGDLLYEDDGIKAEREKCEKLLGKAAESNTLTCNEHSHIFFIRHISGSCQNCRRGALGRL